MQQVASLSELELSDVLGLTLSAAALTELLAVDGRLDQLERNPRRNGWVVGLGDRDVGPGQPLPVVLDRTLSYPAAADDSLELCLTIWQQPAATLLVCATVDVYCFCPVDHNIHYAAESERSVGAADELAPVVSAAVTDLETWAALDLSAGAWRARAGLPDRPGPQG